VRSLTPEETALWARVAATIRPLSREKNKKPSPEPGGEAAKLVEGAHVSGRGSTAGPLHHAAPRRGPPPRPGEELQGTLDGTWDRRLSSGAVAPDRIVDLHGMSLDGAWQAIDRALDQGIARGERVLLLITGGIFVIEALSVLIQVVAFQRFRRRVFLMAPVHHHFELMAWSETKIILRFWIIAAISAAIGFTLYQQSIT